MLYSRTILAKISHFLDKKVNLLVLGSRQVGKTVLLQLIRQEILNRGLAQEQQIFFLNLEKGQDLNLLTDKQPQQFVDYLYLKSTLPTNTPLFVFIDEIQYLAGASSFIKILADEYPQIRLILSGSSSLEIKKIFTDRLTGRKISFQLPTLTFKEYLVFQQHPLASAWQKLNPENILEKPAKILKSYTELLPEILPIYEEFVLYGGYPRPSLKENQTIRQELLAEIRDQYARRDVSDILKIENIAGFNRLLGLLAAQIGNLVNLDELANSANLNRQTVEKYLFLLQETFIIKLLTPYYTNPRQELIKMPKIYFADTGLRNLLIEQIINQPLELRPDKGALIENTVWHEFSLLKWPINFWRTKAKSEVDFIITAPANIGQNKNNLIPLEVKYQLMNQPSIPSGLAAFIKKYQPAKALVATKNFFGQTKYGSTPVYFVPAAFF